jgi:uncharacterized protein
MILPDVNVLVYAHREDVANHTRYRDWLQETINAPQSFGMCDVVLSGFLRVVTHPRVFAVPTPMERALEFADAIRTSINCVAVTPGERHWEIFAGLCAATGVRGNLVPDAWFAALAIESGSDWITSDRDYARFAGLRWRHPLAESA